MSDISDSLRLLFETSIEATDDGYVVPIPTELVENGSLTVEDQYRVALLTAATAPESSPGTSGQDEDSPPTQSRSIRAAETGDESQRRSQSPPVEEGEIRTVTIDTLGDQGDGIAKVERGFIIIVPGTQPGDQVEVKITDVKDTVAFAESIGEATVR